MVVRSLLSALAALFVAAPAPAAPPVLGVQVHALWSADSHREMLRELDHAAALGVTAVRADVGWSSLQAHGPGTFDAWYVEKLDAFFAAAHERGLGVLVTLNEAPCWASSAPASLRRGCQGEWWGRGVQEFSPRDPRDYGRAARFVTRRYGDRMVALELWNEPNLSGEFRGAGDKARRYAALVRATYPRARAGDPGVPVIVGATSHSDVRFLGRVYAAGIRGRHDGVSIHPYADGREPLSTSAPPFYEFGAGIESVRALQVLVGQVTPLWVTEFGYTSCATDRCVSPAVQAARTAASVRALPRFPYLAGAFLYQLRDATTDPDDEEANFGLLTEDFTPRPVYDAFRYAVSEAPGRR